MIEKQIKFYDDNIEELLEKYEGSVLIISEDYKIDAFASIGEAYTFGVEHYGLGNFLMRECKKKASNSIHILTPGIVVL